MLNAGLDSLRPNGLVCKVPPAGGGFRLLVLGVVVRVFIAHCCVADGVETML